MTRFHTQGMSFSNTGIAITLSAQKLREVMERFGSEGPFCAWPTQDGRRVQLAPSTAWPFNSKAPENNFSLDQKTDVYNLQTHWESLPLDLRLRDRFGRCEVPHSSFLLGKVPMDLTVPGPDQRERRCLTPEQRVEQKRAKDERLAARNARREAPKDGVVVTAHPQQPGYGLAGGDLFKRIAALADKPEPAPVEDAAPVQMVALLIEPGYQDGLARLKALCAETSDLASKLNSSLVVIKGRVCALL